MSHIDTPPLLPIDAERYLHVIRGELLALPETERDSILDEIRAQFIAQATFGPDAVQKLMARLGPAHTLGHTFAKGYELTTTLTRTNPTPLIRTIASLATKSTVAFFGTIGIVICYTATPALLVMAIGKALFPTHVGWVHTLEATGLIMSSTPLPAPDPLGYGTIPLTLGLSLLAFLLGTKIARLTGRTLLRRLPLLPEAR